MSTTEIIAIAVIVIVVAIVAWYAGSRRRSERLRERFGPEYDRTVGETHDKAKAEADLDAREERVQSLDIRPLSAADRDRYQARWREVQALFVDDPAQAVSQADALIGEVMRARGYPVGDFEQRAADISVNHPQVVDHYRTAHRIASSRTNDTEQQRQAFVHYRALFADLLETGDGDRSEAERADEAAATARDDRGARTAADEAAQTPPADTTTTNDDTTTPAEPARRA